MTKLGPYELNRVHCVDAMEGLPQLPDGSVQCCVTSPPYWGLRDYKIPPTTWGGKNGCVHEWGDVRPRRNRKATDVVDMQSKQATNAGAQHDLNPAQFCIHCDAWRGCLGLEPTPELYIEHIVTIFRELRRALRADGVLWLNLGDSYDSQPCRNGKSFRRDKKEGLYPTRGLSNLKPKDLCGIPWRVALALQADGWWLRSDIIWAKPNPMPESVTDRPTKSHEYIFLLTKSAKYFYDADAVREKAIKGSAESRFNRGKTAIHQANRSSEKEREESFGRNLRTVWSIPIQPTPEAHFATFPEELPRRCIKAGTSEMGACPECGAPWEPVVEKSDAGQNTKMPDGWATHVGAHGTIHKAGREKGQPNIITRSQTLGWRPACSCDAGEPIPCIVLDPFAGTGRTCKTAIKLGRRAIGFDISADYVAKFAAPKVEAARQGLTVKELDAGQGTLFT